MRRLGVKAAFPCHAERGTLQGGVKTDESEHASDAALQRGTKKRKATRTETARRAGTGNVEPLAERRLEHVRIAAHATVKLLHDFGRGALLRAKHEACATRSHEWVVHVTHGMEARGCHPRVQAGGVNRPHTAQVCAAAPKLLALSIEEAHAECAGAAHATVVGGRATECDGYVHATTDKRIGDKFARAIGAREAGVALGIGQQRQP